MKILFLILLAVFLSSGTLQKNEFLGTWNVGDSYNSEDMSLKDVAMHSMIKKKIIEQQSQIIFTTDSIMIKQNGAVSDRSRIRNLKKISKDSLTFQFDNHSGSFKLKTNKQGILIVDKKTVFQLEK